MLPEVYKKLKQAENIHRFANRLDNYADDIEENACKIFNKNIKIEDLQELLRLMDGKAFDGEKEDIKELLNKKQKEDLDVEDIQKYKFLEDKYGENLDHNKSFIDRFAENMGD